MAAPRLGLLTLLLGAFVALVLGSGPVALAGGLGLALWVLLDLAADRRRDGWRSALTTKGVTLFLVACMTAAMSGPPWLSALGWAGLLVGSWAGASAIRSLSAAQPQRQPVDA